MWYCGESQYSFCRIKPQPASFEEIFSDVNELVNKSHDSIYLPQKNLSQVFFFYFLKVLSRLNNWLKDHKKMQAKFINSCSGWRIMIRIPEMFVLYLWCSLYSWLFWIRCDKWLIMLVDVEWLRLFKSDIDC